MMDELEKLAWLIAEEFVRTFESLEALALKNEEKEETQPLVMSAKA